MMNRQIGDFSFISGQWPLAPNKPTVIFIHGAATSKGLWQYQVEALSDLVNTVALDLPGHGSSGGNGFDRISDYARSVIDFMDIVRPGKTILCGLSMGGAVAQDLLIHHPERFSAAILMHTGAKLKVMPLIFETIRKDYRQYFEMMIHFAMAGETDKPRMIGLLKDVVGGSPEVALKDFYACDAFNVVDQLQAIASPVLVIVGDEDNVTPPKYGEFLASRIVASRLITIHGTGHVSPLEKPEAVNQVLRDFILEMNLLDNQPRI
ncbi:MAG: alpha/beta hydrolase [Desulfobacterales bacterium]|jgi:pimeloyl-ACP methyl ester carboxylesterase|nr:alpha/beta hydrolase [Desulfobacterales bacterium]